MPQTLTEVARVVGLSPQRLRALVDASLVQPERAGRRYRFSFAELSWLRSLAALSPVPSVAEIVRAVDAWRERAGPDASPSAVVWRRVGKRLVVSSPDGSWEPATGQAELAFEAERGDDAPREVVVINSPILGREPSTFRRTTRDDIRSPRADVIDHLLERGRTLRLVDPRAARRAYADVLRRYPEHPTACLNLGRLLHQRGRIIAAARLYERAVASSPSDATPWFNLGVAREDQHRVDEALRCYREAIAREPEHADAHFNAARLCERIGDHLGAFRHMTAYRRAKQR